MQQTVQDYKDMIRKIKELLLRKKDLFKSLRSRLEEKKIEKIKNEMYGNE